MGCCGRPNNRAGKGGPASYYERYGYLSSSQRAKQTQLVGSKCEACDALTMTDVNNNCTTCGGSKLKAEEAS
jgi:hypothetical protein